VYAVDYSPVPYGPIKTGTWVGPGVSIETTLHSQKT